MPLKYKNSVHLQGPGLVLCLGNRLEKKRDAPDGVSFADSGVSPGSLSAGPPSPKEWGGEEALPASPFSMILASSLRQTLT